MRQVTLSRSDTAGVHKCTEQYGGSSKPLLKKAQSVEMQPLGKSQKDSKESSTHRISMGNDCEELAQAAGHLLGDITESGCTCCAVNFEAKVNAKWLFFTVGLCLLAIAACVVALLILAPESYNKVSHIECEGTIPLTLEYVTYLNTYVSVGRCQSVLFTEISETAVVLDTYIQSWRDTLRENGTLVFFEYSLDIANHRSVLAGMFVLEAPSRVDVDSFRLYAVQPNVTDAVAVRKSRCVEEVRILRGNHFKVTTFNNLLSREVAILCYVCGSTSAVGLDY